MDTPGTDQERFGEIGPDALAGADLVVYAVDAGTGLLPADGKFLAREVRGRGHARFLVGGTGVDRLGRRPAGSPEALRARIAAQAGIPPNLVFLLGLPSPGSPAADLEPFRRSILGSAAARDDVKGRVSLLLLRAELAAGAGQDLSLRAFADRLDRVLHDHFPFPLTEGRLP